MMKKAEVFINGLFKDNSICKQVLGICSALAVTNLLLNSLVMGLGVIWTLSLSNITISLIRDFIPKQIRMIVQTLIIASYVIMVDIFLRAFYPEMSRALGPYVGLIITNCIIMGRAEAFAQKNKPSDSLIDGLAAGIGYTIVLLIIAFFRELLGFGSIFGLRVFGNQFVSWSIMVMAPSAFFLLGLLIWFFNNIKKSE